MNLNANPTPDELRTLLRSLNDSASHHVLWVSKFGDVHVAPVSAPQPDADMPDAQLRFETFLSGNEYVGPDAAADDEWVAELFDRLNREWQSAKGRPTVALAEAI